MRNLSNQNDFDLHGNGHEGDTHFHMNGFAPRLVLKQRQRATRKWPIEASQLKILTYTVTNNKALGILN